MSSRQTISGEVRAANPYYKRTVKLFSDSLEIGAYQTISGVHYSHLTVYVPVPGAASHAAGIVLRLHNAAYSSFTQIPLEDYDRVIDFLTTNRQQLAEALIQQTNRIDDIQQIDKAINMYNYKIIKEGGVAPSLEDIITPSDDGLLPSPERIGGG